MHFDNKRMYNDNKQLDLTNQISTENLYISINNIFNNKNKISIKDSNEEIKIDNENTKRKIITENNRAFRISRLGIVKPINFNNNNLKLNKLLNSDMTLNENRNNLQTAYKVIEEVDEEKDMPWIREEDC